MKFALSLLSALSLSFPDHGGEEPTPSKLFAEWSHRAETDALFAADLRAIERLAHIAGGGKPSLRWPLLAVFMDRRYQQFSKVLALLRADEGESLAFKATGPDDQTRDGITIAGLVFLQNVIDPDHWPTDAELLAGEISALPFTGLDLLAVHDGIVTVQPNLHSLSIALEGAHSLPTGSLKASSDPLVTALNRYFTLRLPSEAATPGFVATYDPGSDGEYMSTRLQAVLMENGIAPIVVHRRGRDSREVVLDLAIQASAYAGHVAAIIVPGYLSLFEASHPNEPMMVSDDPDLVKGYDVSPVLSQIAVASVISLGQTPVIGAARTTIPLVEPLARRLTLSYQLPQLSYDEKVAEITAMAHAIPGAQLNQQDIVSLARLDLSPSQRRQAVYTTALTGSAQAAMDAIARSSASLAPAIEVPDIDLSLIVCKQDLGELIERLKAAPRGPMPVLMNGSPGTGKSDFGRYAAYQMGYRSRVYRYSDLTSKWHSESEKLVARMFANARENNEAIVMDEVDSLFVDREQATHEWQKTLTNAFLTHLDVHPLPVFCSTNHKDDIDPAIKRRFVFKLDFEALSPDLIEVAFRRFFGCSAPHHALALQSLTPGDFAVVRTKAGILGIRNDPPWFVSALEEELANKPQKRATTGGMGFLQHAC